MPKYDIKLWSMVMEAAQDSDTLHGAECIRGNTVSVVLNAVNYAQNLRKVFKSWKDK